MKYKGKAFYDTEMKKLRDAYNDWKVYQKENKATFFILYSEFKDIHLKETSGGAIKLFLYLGFHANNNTGECWHSTESIAEFFGNDPRTVKKWIAELEERKMIVRIQSGYKRIANTFLVPYGGGEHND